MYAGIKEVEEEEESLGYYELKNEQWLDEGCSELLDQRKQVKF
jgi:hypothetical protein